ncbi:hypothetical protein HRbin15_02509 [bacterium HR15]|nr:hypothetical protein HRbin15_02509 [bacterium HR15]
MRTELEVACALMRARFAHLLLFSRRGAGGLACGLLLLTASHAQREMFNYTLTFNTVNQCMWQPGTCNIGYTYFLGGSFNGSRSGGGFFTIPVLGEFGVQGSASGSGRLGLNFEAYATGGDVTVSYPMQLTISYPTRENLVPGGVAVIQSSYKLLPGARLGTTSPTARFVMSSIIDLQASFSVRARAFSADILNQTISIPRINYNQELINTDNLNLWDQDFDLLPSYPGLLTLNVHRPLIVTEGGNPFNLNEVKLTSTGSDRFVTLTGDLTAATVYLIQSLLGLPPNNYLRKDISYYGLSAGYSLLQTEVRTGIGFRQDFEFNPRPKIRLTFSDGRAPVEFYAGESVSIRMPLEGALTVNASVVMDNQFKNITYITISGGIYFLPMSVYASGAIGSISLGSFEFKPVDEMGIGSTLPIQIFNRTFTLGGFTEQLAGALTVRANTDATPGIFYSVNYNSPTSARIGDPNTTIYLECRPFNYFTSGSRVWFRNTELSTTQIETNVVRAVIPSSLLNTLGEFQLFVRTPGKPDTNTLPFAVGYKQPVIDEVENSQYPGDHFNGFVIGSAGDQDLFVDFNTSGSNASYYPNDITKVYWNDQRVEIVQMGSGNPTNFMRVRVPNRYLWQPGDIVLKVVNPGPGGGEGLHHVAALYPPPFFDDDNDRALSPRRGRSIGTQGITLRIRGSNFIKGVSEVILKEENNTIVPLSTQYVSSAELRAQFPANLMQTARSVYIDIRHPAYPSGYQHTGNAKQFTILNPVAFVERCEPNVVNRGDAPPSFVEVRGFGFLPSSQVLFNGVAVSTTYISNTRLRFTLPAGTMNTGRVNSVKVRNPQTDGIDSNEEWFTVRNPAPTLTALNPNMADIFAANATVDIFGSGFESTARAYFAGVPLTTAFINATQVRATIPGILLRNTGVYPITVRNEPSIDSNALNFTVRQGEVIFVSPQGNDANSGITWASAKRTVQAGIDAAVPPQGYPGRQVWVKAGVYNERISLRSGVHVYGGFAGWETERSQRNLLANESVLDANNAGTVVTIPANTTDATLDGFTVRNGNRADGGGGVYMLGNGSVVISNNLILNNTSTSASGGGAGVYIHGATARGASVQLLNNVIVRNMATHAAGLYMRYATVNLVNNTIAYNVSNQTSTGAAVYASDETQTLLANNIIAFQTNGACIERKNVSTAVMTLRNNCVFGATPPYRNINPTNDLAVNPNFVDAANNNFHLGDSPCIDAGNNADANPALIPVDFDGQARVNGIAIDIGADEVYAQTPILTVPGGTAQIRTPVNLTATLRRSDNNLPIANQTLEFFVEGVSVGTATTQSNGTATLGYLPPESLGVGNKALRVEFAGNTAYNPVQQNAVLLVQRGNTSLALTAQPSQVSVGQQMTLGGTLLDATNAPVANRTLRILWNGVEISTGQTNASGEYLIPYIVPRGTPRGNNTVRVEFTGDTLLNGSFAQGTVQVVNTAPEASLAGATLIFNGTNSFVQADHRAELNAYPLTLSCWVRTLDTSDQERGIINKYVSGSLNGYQIYLRQGRVYAWYFRNGSNYVWDVGRGLDGGSIADGLWHHVQFVVDASGGKLYVDGTLRASRAWTGTPGAPSTTTPLMIGRYPGTPMNGYFLGEIDEVKLWNRADISLDEKSRKAMLVGNEEGLLAYFRLDEGAGNQSADSVSGATATLVNAPQWATSTAPVETVYLTNGVPRTLRLNAYDPNNDPLSYNQLNGPTGSVWSGAAFPNATLLPPTGGTSGAFNYRVTDGLLNSNTASGNIQSVYAPYAGLGGSSRYLNGNTNSYIRVPGFGNIAPTDEITIEFWQLVAEPRACATIDLNGGTASNRIVVHSPWSDGRVYFDFGNITTQGRLSYVPPQSIVGTWQHFAFVASRSGNFMRIYRNGVLEAQKTGMTSFTRGNFDLYLSSPLGPQSYFGLIDEVRIWNRARTQREIQRDMHATLAGNERGLVGYWRLDEWGNSVTVANDSSPSGAHGTYSNARWVASTAPIDTVNLLAASRTFTLGGFMESLSNPNQLTYPITLNPASGVLQATGNQATYTPDQPGVYEARYRADYTSMQSNRARIWLVVPRPGDADGNGCVDDGDLLQVLFAFGTDNPDTDLNNDGIVDDADLLQVLFNFGNGC